MQGLGRCLPDRRDGDSSQGPTVETGVLQPVEEVFDAIGTGEDDPIKASEIADGLIDRRPVVGRLYVQHGQPGHGCEIIRDSRAGSRIGLQTDNLNDHRTEIEG